MDKNNNDIEKINSILEKRQTFAFLPTPLHKLGNLSECLNGPNIYIKRDDMTGLALGGNKTRKLEYLIKEALDNKSDVVLTVGAPQSNHCRQTAAACSLNNLECHLILIGKDEENLSTGNILLDNLLGAKIHYFNNVEEAYLSKESLLNELKLKGKNPYYIPPGGSNAAGLNGYINAYKEILEYEQRFNLKFDYIFFASSSYGTHAGLAIGNYVYGDNKKKIYGISICKNFLDSKSQITQEERVCNLVQEYNMKYNCNVQISYQEIILDQRFNECGYAIMSEDDRRAISLFAQKEAIILDPVYTARAAAGMIKIIEAGEIPKNCNILFIHTGGSPAIFTNLFK